MYDASGGETSNMIEGPAAGKAEEISKLTDVLRRYADIQIPSFPFGVCVLVCFWQ